MPVRILAALLLGAAAVAVSAAPPGQPAAQAKPKPPAKPRTEAAATPAAAVKAAAGFRVDLMYSVPKESQGSWVNLCVDPKGRLIASDQYGALYRVTPPAVGAKGEAKVEKLNIDIGMAQGLVYAFDALYVVVNASKNPGLYRVTDTDGDDVPDKVELLRKFDGGGGGEHGPHAVLKHPDGKRLTVVCGNQTPLVKLDSTLVPKVWGDDHLLPRVPDGNGFMKGVLAPGGCIYNCDPDGQKWELVSMGFRNPYDAGYNRAGELFTFDADMEWDMNTPWYRPTRVCHVVPGADWGWRNGAGKYREYYADTLPPVVNVGPGSPTGVCFGYGAKFPAKYQDAFFISDWSYGKLYAVHMTPQGASYTGTLEEFVTGTPLPLTDVVINPIDGAMYFAVGGRKTQSGLYRVTYTGSESTAASPAPPVATAEAALRKKLEDISGSPSFAVRNRGVEQAWPHLASPDRFIRTAARNVLEGSPSDSWHAKAFAETDPRAALTALLAVARKAAPCPHHVPAAPPRPGANNVADMMAAVTKARVLHERASLLGSLGRLDFAGLSTDLKLDHLRVLSVALHRLSADPAEQQAIVARLDPLFPTGSRPVDVDILNVLVYLQAPSAAVKGMALLAVAPTQEEQIDIVMALRMAKAGWTPESRTQYFQWFVRAAGYKGGNSFQGFLRLIKADAVAALSAEEKAAIKPVLDAKPTAGAVATGPARPHVKKWVLADLTPQVETLLAAGHRDYDRGRRLFGAANCFACHRYDNEGGNTGPDLSGVAGRFNTKDLLESILDPSKEISDQYAAVEIATLDGRVVVGRIANLNGDVIMVNTNGLDPDALAKVNRNDIEMMKPSRVSMMPAGLLDTLTADEAADLAAYLLSRGDRRAAVFKK